MHCEVRSVNSLACTILSRMGEGSGLDVQLMVVSVAYTAVLAATSHHPQLTHGATLVRAMTHDLSNRRLIAGIIISLCSTFAIVVIARVISEPWARPGSALGQSAAILGAGALLLSAIGAILKRAGQPARRNFNRHIWLGCIGFVLVSMHSGGNFYAPPALLLLALVLLMGLGVWARTIGAQRMAATFGSKSGALSAYDPARRERLKSLITDKHVLLARIDPSANEAIFSLTLTHWFGSPAKAYGYHRLVREERALLGTDHSVGMAQAYWRRVHRLIALAFVTGLVVHVVLVTFFAAYVAEGRDIYWWHLTAWDF
ncbi:MAG: hypothetical protein ACI8W7_003859 [Gammaproteobacteria bacterium]|jgi:hypothetical protein